MRVGWTGVTARVAHIPSQQYQTHSKVLSIGGIHRTCSTWLWFNMSLIKLSLNWWCEGSKRHIRVLKKERWGEIIIAVSFQRGVGTSQSHTRIDVCVCYELTSSTSLPPLSRKCDLHMPPTLLLLPHWAIHTKSVISVLWKYSPGDVQHQFNTVSISQVSEMLQ